MGNKSSSLASHVPPSQCPRDIRQVYFNAGIPVPPPGHPGYLGMPPPPPPPPPPLGHHHHHYGGGPPSFHQSFSSLHHPSGTDSGYMTSPADTERWKAHCYKNGHSRLSLNEPFMFDNLPPPFMPLPPLNPKQVKKLQKKQKKLLKKIGTMPPPMMPAAPPPIPPYSRAFSVDNLNNHVLDGYAELPAVNKRSWKIRKEHKKSHHLDEIPQVPPGPPRSTISSNCSNGFTISEIRGQTSCPSTNLSDHSRITSSNTEHSSSFLRSLSSGHSRNSPVTNEKHTLSEKSSSDNQSAETQPTIETITQQHHERLRRSSPDLSGEQEREKRKNNHEIKTTVQVEKYVPYMSQVETHEKYSSQAEKCEPLRSAGIERDELKKHRYSDNNARSNRCYESENYRTPSSSMQCNNERSNEKRRISDSGEGNENMAAERTIPIKITPEAKQILERNAQLFPRNSVDDHDEPQMSSTTDNYERQQSALSSSTPNGCNASHLGCSGLQSLKKNAEYGSTISSLTQSSNMKTEVSDIDFSWVNDVENRLDREIAFVKEDYPKHQMPVRYFGVPTPVEQNCTSGAPSRNSKKSPLIPQQLCDENDTRKELSQIRSDVRSKAAMFDSEALRSERNAEQHQEVNMRYRSRSNPRSNDVYIPHPDYRNYNPISVDTSEIQSHRYYNGSRNPEHTKDSPDQRRIRKPVVIKDENRITSRSVSMGNQQKYYEWNRMPNRVDDYRNDETHRSRQYDVSDYYRQNPVRRNHEKTWRASVAY